MQAEAFLRTDLRSLQNPGAVCAYRTRTAGIGGFVCMLPLTENCLARLKGEKAQRCLKESPDVKEARLERK